MIYQKAFVALSGLTVAIYILMVTATAALADAPVREAQNFVQKAAQAGMMEVELGKLAEQQGGSPAIKSFGNQMVNDHGKANDELKQIAAQKNLAVPTGLNPEHKQAIERLSQMKDTTFDRAFAEQMVSDHQNAVKLFEAQSTENNDQALQTFAKEKLPTLRDHLQMAQGLLRDTKQDQK